VSTGPRLQLSWLPHGEGLAAPAYATAGSAGMDVRAAVPADAPVAIAPGQRALISTGFAMAIEPGFEAQMRPRSGLAIRHGVTCLNTPGTIDSDYRGEVKIILINLGSETFTVKRGDRIAQMVIAPVSRAAVNVMPSLEETERGAGGFGSTGKT
jgi:dUTP pyrophosphatase